MWARTLLSSSTLLLLFVVDATHGFALEGRRGSNCCRTKPHHRTIAATALSMGLFDGVKDAFSAPALERTSIDAERETPIDRWMGWSVAKENKNDGGGASSIQAVPADYVDSMDAVNYVTVTLTKPMGIVFEENDADYGGIFVHSLKENGIAAENGSIRAGDQLVAVNDRKVSGQPFDDALGAITETTGDALQLLFFRGTAVQFYGPTGASQDWLDEYIRGVNANVSEKETVENVANNE